jgi:O-acetyl-ADP-ribose deacetylase (regulator of RNase III)
LLAACYRNTLALARVGEFASIAFPAISCGVYGYPLDEAVAIAVREVVAGVETMPTLELVVFACFGTAALTAYERALDAMR